MQWVGATGERRARRGGIAALRGFVFACGACCGIAATAHAATPIPSPAPPLVVLTREATAATPENGVLSPATTLVPLTPLTPEGRGGFVTNTPARPRPPTSTPVASSQQPAASEPKAMMTTQARVQPTAVLLPTPQGSIAPRPNAASSPRTPTPPRPALPAATAPPAPARVLSDTPAPLRLTATPTAGVGQTPIASTYGATAAYANWPGMTPMTPTPLAAAPTETAEAVAVAAVATGSPQPTATATATDVTAPTVGSASFIVGPQPTLAPPVSRPASGTSGLVGGAVFFALMAFGIGGVVLWGGWRLARSSR